MPTQTATATRTSTVTPVPVSGRVTGGGTVLLSDGRATFGLEVQRKQDGGPATGQVTYVDHSAGEVVHSTTITTLIVAGPAASFGGTCTRNGVPCSFTATVQDLGEPGRNDDFFISVNGGPAEGGTLVAGNIQIHK